MIPHILHLYWGGGRVSFLQYLTVLTFKTHNPDWEVWLWYPKEPNNQPPDWASGEQSTSYIGDDFSDKLQSMCEYKEIDLRNIGLPYHLHEIQRSDYVRCYLLYEYGGVWSDIDFLFIRPIDKLLENDFNYTISYQGFWSNGFIISRPKQQVMIDLMQEIIRRIRVNHKDDYQSLGTRVYANLFKNYETMVLKYPNDKIYNLPSQIVYPYSPETDYDGVYSTDIERMFYGNTDKTTNETIGFHWFNGHPLAKKYQNNMRDYLDNGSIVSKIVKEYYVFNNNAD